MLEILEIIIPVSTALDTVQVQVCNAVPFAAICPLIQLSYPAKLHRFLLVCTSEVQGNSRLFLSVVQNFEQILRTLLTKSRPDTVLAAAGCVAVLRTRYKLPALRLFEV